MNDIFSVIGQKCAVNILMVKQNTVPLTQVGKSTYYK